MENELPQKTGENTQISSEEKIREMTPGESAFFGLIFISAIAFGIYKMFGKRTAIALTILFVWGFGMLYIGLSDTSGSASSKARMKNNEYILYLVLFVIFYVLNKYLK
jgi:hypothetical protein